MTGDPGRGWSLQRRAACARAVAVLGALTACDAAGSAGRRGGSAEGVAGTADAAPATQLVETDVEAPDVFQATDQGLWDGRPSLGGIWVAHPDVASPERVVIRNRDNGQFVIGALFRRERDNPGPPIQVSSDAAEALGMLAGAPATLDVTALRREEVADEPPAGAATGAPAEAGDPEAGLAEGGTEPGTAADAPPDGAAEVTAADLAGTRVAMSLLPLASAQAPDLNPPLSRDASLRREADDRAPAMGAAEMGPRSSLVTATAPDAATHPIAI